MICGIDEAGRGPVMGPLVVGCVYVEDDSELRGIGVKDSKKLTPSVRERMYDEITASVSDYCVVVLSAEDIDEKMGRMSLNDIELEMFAEAASKTHADTVYADCPDVDETRFSASLASAVPGSDIVGRHRADDTYPVVSAASIIAKVTRDRMMQRISEEFGRDIGSGYPSDETTMEFIREWISKNRKAPKHTRTSWEPVKKLLMVSRNTRITDW